jgi:hypothetical protein
MASPFASRVVVTLPIPFDPPNEVTIRKLAGRHLERARNVFMTGLFLDVQARGGAAVQKDMQSLFKKDDSAEQADIAEQVKKVAADPLNGFDPYVVAQGGIVAWTYPESLSVELMTDEKGNGVPRVRAIDDLDEDAVRWFATEIMRLTKPSLFQTEAEAEAARKND